MYFFLRVFNQLTNISQHLFVSAPWSLPRGSCACAAAPRAGTRRDVLQTRRVEVPLGPHSKRPLPSKWHNYTVIITFYYPQSQLGDFLDVQSKILHNSFSTGIWSMFFEVNPCPLGFFTCCFRWLRWQLLQLGG